MAIGVEFREIQNLGGKAQLKNDAVQRLWPPSAEDAVAFVLPPAAPYTARVFKVVVPTLPGQRPPAFSFYPADGEEVQVVPDARRGGAANLVPVVGENAYVFHEVLPGTLMAYRESAAYPKGGGSDSDSEEEGDDIMTEYGTVGEDGRLTIVNGVETNPATGAITFGSNNVPAGALPVKRGYVPPSKDGYVTTPVVGQWEINLDGTAIIQKYLYLPAKYVDPSESSEEEPTVVGQPVMLPFFVRREDENSANYVVYLPANSIKYGSKYVTFSNVSPASEADWFYMTDIGAVDGSIWCFVAETGSGEVVAEFVCSSSDVPPVRSDALTFFKVARIDASVHEGLYGGITQVAAGQEGLLPDDLAEINPHGIGSGDTRVPFLVYPDKGDGDSGVDDSESDIPSAFMYLPAGSLTIAGEEVEFDGVDGGYLPVADDTSYWCEIFRVVGKGLDDGIDSSDSESEEDEVVRYMAAISTDEVPSDGVVLRFKVTDVKKGVNCDQLVFGAVTLGPLPDYSQLVAWQVAQIDYQDSSGSKKLYRMFLPENGTISYNGFSLPIQEAAEGWYDMDEDIGKGDSTKRYYCVIYKLTAHLFTEEEFNSFMAAHSDEQSNIQASFPVCEVKTGTGGGVEGDSNTKKALIVTTENGYFAGAPHNRPGANADAKMWSSVFSGMTTSENIMHLSDGQADAVTVGKALDLVCGSAGLSIFMISTHGGADGSMEIYNDTLTPSILAQKFAQSPGPVWFIADCCYSGKSVDDASPGTSRAAKIVREVGEYLRANAPGVPYLGWASTTAVAEGWCQEDGSIFTKSCFRNIFAGVSYADAWAAISADPLVTSMQTPTKVVVNGFDETKPIFGPSAQQS